MRYGTIYMNECHFQMVTNDKHSLKKMSQMLFTFDQVPMNSLTFYTMVVFIGVMSNYASLVYISNAPPQISWKRHEKEEWMNQRIECKNIFTLRKKTGDENNASK